MDSSTLLCETCGYCLQGLEADGPCPECSRPIAHSLPHRRPGSPWQLRPSLAAWLRTNWATLRHPRRTFSGIRIEPRSGTLLLALNLLLTGALLVDPWVGTIIGDPARGARLEGGVRGWSVVTLMFLAETLAAAGLLLLLTWVEYIGVRFFSARRGWRLTREGAWQVCCHASVGWIALGLLPILIMATMQALLRVAHFSPDGYLDLRPFVPARYAWSGVIYAGGALLSLFAGLLTFEMLVYVGVRQCRYAATINPRNPHAPGSLRARAGAAPGRQTTNRPDAA